MREKRPGEWASIDTLYAAIAIDPVEGDGVVGVHTGEGWMPLIVSNRADLDVMLGQIQVIADRSGRPVQVVKFTRDGLVGEFRPGGTT